MNLHLNLTDKVVRIAEDRVECRRLIHREENQIYIGHRLIEGRMIGVFRKPYRVGQSNQNVVMLTGEWFCTKQGVAKALRLLLNDVKNLAAY